MSATQGPGFEERTRQVEEEAAAADEAAQPLPVPEYPHVPGLLGDLIAARGGLPAALVGGAGLAAAAAVCRGAELKIADGWWERPILWIPLLAPRGAGKSPSQDLALDPVRKLDETEHRLYTDLLAEWEATPKKERGPRPTDPTILVGDLTLEHLVRRLAETGGHATMAHDELSMILRALGEYKQGGGGDRGRILSLWSGQAWRYQRVTGGIDILIPRPVVSIVGTIQPYLHHLLGGEEDGLRPRWLPHLATLDLAAQEEGGIGSTPQEWATVLQKLYSQTKARTWKLRGGAFAAWSAARRRWKNAAGGEETASTSAALVKADIQVARIALVLAELGSPAGGGDLPTEAMSAAITIVDYVMDCWRALPEQTGLGLTRQKEILDKAVARMRDWLDEHGGRATRRTLLRAAVASCRTASDLDAVLYRYEETYPGCIRKEAPPTGGPEAVVVYSPSPRKARDVD